MAFPHSNKKEIQFTINEKNGKRKSKTKPFILKSAFNEKIVKENRKTPT